jgi:ATP-dependent RNA helicase DDX24/MAK5
MIQQGSFPQLERILESVHNANPLSNSDDSDNDDQIHEDEDQDKNRLMSLPGIRGESQVEMWSEKLSKLNSKEGEVNSPPARNPDDDQSEDDGSIQESCEGVVIAPVYRQTFVFSATLTLPPSESFAKKKRNKDSKKSLQKSLTGAIAEILDKAHTYGMTKVVDLTSSTQLVTKENDVLVLKEGTQNEKSRLPPGLSLEIIQCTQKHKDSHLYAYLLTTEQGQAGPCLIFCNSIAAVKRVGITLQTLGLPVRMLHANMPQVSKVICSSLFISAMRKLYFT